MLIFFGLIMQVSWKWLHLHSRSLNGVFAVLSHRSLSDSYPHSKGGDPVDVFAYVFLSIPVFTDWAWGTYLQNREENIYMLSAKMRVFSHTEKSIT